MSAIVYYQPVDERCVVRGATSSDVGALTEVFGKMSVVLGREDLPTLNGMAVVCKKEPNPYQQLMEAIEKHGRIRVMVEY